MTTAMTEKAMVTTMMTRWTEDDDENADDDDEEEDEEDVKDGDDVFPSEKSFVAYLSGRRQETKNSQS